jgi:hypothetical protein
VFAAPVFGGDVFHGFVMLISSKYHLSVVMTAIFRGQASSAVFGSDVFL